MIETESWITERRHLPVSKVTDEGKKASENEKMPMGIGRAGGSLDGFRFCPFPHIILLFFPWIPLEASWFHRISTTSKDKKDSLILWSSSIDRQQSHHLSIHPSCSISSNHLVWISILHSILLGSNVDSIFDCISFKLTDSFLIPRILKE